MSDQLPIVPVPESTWLRALAHALDPDAESADESLAPDDEPVGAASDDAGVDDPADDGDDDERGDDERGDDERGDDEGDEASTGVDDAGPEVWDTGDDWVPAPDVADDPHDVHHDDGIG